MPNPIQETLVIPGKSSARPQPRQKRCKVPDTPGEHEKTHTANQKTDDEDEELLPQADSQRKRADPRFPAYIRLRRLGAVHADLPVKVVTTLIALWILVDIPLLQDILPMLAVLKLHGYDTR